jgi:hypothetical protein
MRSERGSWRITCRGWVWLSSFGEGSTSGNVIRVSSMADWREASGSPTSSQSSLGQGTGPLCYSTVGCLWQIRRKGSVIQQRFKTDQRAKDRCYWRRYNKSDETAGYKKCTQNFNRISGEVDLIEVKILRCNIKKQSLIVWTANTSLNTRSRNMILRKRQRSWFHIRGNYYEQFNKYQVLKKYHAPWSYVSNYFRCKPRKK